MKFGGVRITRRTPKSKKLRTNTLIEHTIDYLQLSINYREQTCLDEDHKQLSGVKFYSRGYQDAMGARRYFGNPNSNKALVVLSGSTLHNYRVSGWDDLTTVSDYIDKGASITRIDLCMTEFVGEHLILPDHFADCYEKDLIDSTLVSGGCKTIVGVRRGQERSTQTCYIGDMSKRGKKGIFRAYDKGLELDIGQYMITRVEYEDRGDKAKTTAKRFLESKSIAATFRTRFDCKTTEFDRLCNHEQKLDTFRGQAIIPDENEDEYKRRWEWLINKVAPSLKKSIEFDVQSGLGNGNLETFLKASGIEFLSETE